MFQDIEGIVPIKGTLYVEYEEALAPLLELLKKNYEIEDCSKNEQYPHPGWYARVRGDIVARKGKCKSCSAYIETSGIQTHKHKCEACGAYTYLEFRDGTEIRLEFLSDKREGCDPDIKMVVYEYDDESGSLLLYPDPLDGDNFLCWDAENARKILEQNKEKYTHVQKDGKGLISVPYNLRSVCVEKEAVISVGEIRGSQSNFNIVKLYQGKEYSDYKRVPIIESYDIKEAWRWTPLKSSPVLHERIISAVGMVSRCDYYYQDGRTEFYGAHLEGMRIFVKHFTTLDVNAWDRMIRYADRSGPGMIKAIANFCHSNPEIKDEPNIGNALIGFDKIRKGRSLTSEETREMMVSVKDPETGGIFKQFLRSCSKRFNK